MKKILFVLLTIFLYIPTVAFCQEISEQVSVPAQLIEKHVQSKYGKEMYYLYSDTNTQTIYIIMHGLADGTVMDKVSVETALNHVLTPNKNKLGNFSTIKVVCCFPNRHKKFFSKTWNANVEFISDADSKIIVHAGKQGFRYAEWKDD